MTKHHTAQFYVQLEPEFSSWTDHVTGEKAIRGVKAVGLTKKKPTRPKPGTIIISLAVKVPEPAFLPLRPEAEITIPETFTHANPIEVIAVDPNDCEDLDS